MARDAKLLVNAAWDGTMCESITKRKITLPDAIAAIKNSTPVLDAAAMAYMSSVPAEIPSLGVDFDTGRFMQDVLNAFSGLKSLNFDGHGTISFDNIQGALTKHEPAWRSGPLKEDVFVVQQFCLRLVQMFNSLKERTGTRIANDTAAFASAAAPAAAPVQATEPLRIYNARAGRIKGGPNWPQCVNGPFDWGSLFAPGPDDDEDGHWLTPRMAARIHHVAVVDGDTMLELDDLCPTLPKVARPFFKKSKEWRLSFRDCYLRIALRLQKGLPPRPNCTGEEMALHNIMDRMQDADDAIGDEIDQLPQYPNDDDFDMVKDCAVEDLDVLMLFEDGDPGFDDSDDDDEPDVDNSVLAPGSTAAWMLGSTAETLMNTAHLHPGEWFHAFRNERFNDHI